MWSATSAAEEVALPDSAGEPADAEPWEVIATGAARRCYGSLCARGLLGQAPSSSMFATQYTTAAPDVRAGPRAAARTLEAHGGP
jgi:hypothetical protein